jgi:hypothetical protein
VLQPGTPEYDKIMAQAANGCATNRLVSRRLAPVSRKRPNQPSRAAARTSAMALLASWVTLVRGPEPEEVSISWSTRDTLCIEFSCGGVGFTAAFRDGRLRVKLRDGSVLIRTRSEFNNVRARPHELVGDVSSTDPVPDI